MKNSAPKLYIGPMSINIVDSVIELSEERNIDLGFCASRRQIEYNSGYVNNWTTKTFSKYVKDRSRVLVCRDHGGPGQGIGNNDSFNSFVYDAKFMDVIHIDPWKNFDDLKQAINETTDYIKFCNSVNDNCLYEVGTEEAIRKITSEELYILLSELKKRLEEHLFDQIVYAVIQSGTSLKEDKNTGDYDKIRLKKMVEVCKEFSVLSKEHNGDYLDTNIIKEKFNIGLDAINIAPEFGVIETLCVLDRIAGDDKLFEEIYNLCYESGKWKKWVDDKFAPSYAKRQTIKICCHYIFSDKTFKEILKS